VTINQNKKSQSNTSINESTIYAKPIAQQYKPVILDTTSKKILKHPMNGLKKLTTNVEHTFVVDKNNVLRNDKTLPSSSIAQSNPPYEADWTILPCSEMGQDELELDTTITLV